MQKIFSSKSGWFYLLIVLLVINIGASFWSLRFDLSSEKKYTLSAPVKQMLRNVHDEVNIDIYLQGNLKSGLRKLRNSTEALLQDFNDYADGNIHYRFVDPVAGGDDTTRAMILDSLSRMGIQPMTVVAQAKKGEEQSQRIVIPAAMVKYKNKVFPVDLLEGVH